MASTFIKSFGEIDKILKARIESAMKKTQQQVYEALQDSIREFYGEYSPIHHQRQFKFFNSLIKTEIKKNGNTYSCEVKIDESYLKYQYKNQGFNPNLPATGEDVAHWANRDIPGAGNHGGTVDVGRDEGFWDIGMRDLGMEYGILEIFKNNLKKRRINFN